MQWDNRQADTLTVNNIMTLRRRIRTATACSKTTFAETNLQDIVLKHHHEIILYTERAGNDRSRAD